MPMRRGRRRGLAQVAQANSILHGVHIRRPAAAGQQVSEAELLNAFDLVDLRLGRRRCVFENDAFPRLERAVVALGDHERGPGGGEIAQHAGCRFAAIPPPDHPPAPAAVTNFLSPIHALTL